jgi:hypothetical protein
VVFLHVQTADVLGKEELEPIRRGGAKIVSWSGDVRAETPQWAIDIAPYVDLHLWTNMRDVEKLRSLGFAADYLQIGFTDRTFRPSGPTPSGLSSAECRPTASAPSGPYSVVFCGNNYGKAFPLSEQRFAMCDRLRKKYGNRFALFGTGWPWGNSWIDEESEAAVYRSAKIVICQNHFNDVSRFSSDRLWRITGSGAFCLCNEYPGMGEEFEVGGGADAAGVFSPNSAGGRPAEIASFNGLHDLEQKIDFWLRPENNEERIKIAAAGCKRAHECHTWRNRASELVGLLKMHKLLAA